MKIAILFLTSMVYLNFTGGKIDLSIALLKNRSSVFQQFIENMKIVILFFTSMNYFHFTALAALFLVSFPCPSTGVFCAQCDLLPLFSTRICIILNNRAKWWFKAKYKCYQSFCKKVVETAQEALPTACTKKFKKIQRQEAYQKQYTV
ncbi:uncharacterized protein LOC117170681 isoform X2 [Belonocnema kinseyi]|uniref:uncharacterized protein LOC117170681 isoform X2 n=1 Tax=Belonocnema kinseyi TaxID=2817044 RepID=UPI00143D37BB|nr:uncharacterized protein LOC117170681 isoform X2 [Belonocnema kinseyi]